MLKLKKLENRQALEAPRKLGAFFVYKEETVTTIYGDPAGSAGSLRRQEGKAPAKKHTSGSNPTRNSIAGLVVSAGINEGTRRWVLLAEVSAVPAASPEEIAAFELAKKDPKAVLDNERRYWHLPFYQKLIDTAFDTLYKSDSEGAVPYLNLVKSRPNLLEIIATIVKQHPSEIKDVIDLVLQVSTEQGDCHVLVGMLDGVLENSTGRILEIGQKLLDSHFERLSVYIQVAAEKVMKEKSYSLILENGGVLRATMGTSAAEAMIEKAARAISAGNGSFYLVQDVRELNEIKKKPYAKELLLIVANESPVSLIGYSDRFIDEPYAEEVLAAAAAKSPKAIVDYQYGSYGSKPWGAELVRQAKVKLQNQ